MNTATLTKPRDGGVQEAKPVSAELPEQLIRTRLAKKLAAYNEAVGALADAKGHLSRSQVDEQKALDDESLGDEESADRIAISLKNQGIYGARVTSREANVKKLRSELESAVSDAHTELFNLVRAELKRREAILVERVCTAIQIVDRARISFDWIEILDFCEPFRTIRNLEPSPFQTFAGSAPDYVTRTACKLLEGYQTIQTESEKSI